MTVKAKSDVTTKQSRFSLTIINESDIKIERIFFGQRPRSATTPAGATRAHARGVTAGVVVL